VLEHAYHPDGHEASLRHAAPACAEHQTALNPAVCSGSGNPCLPSGMPQGPAPGHYPSSSD